MHEQQLYAGDVQRIFFSKRDPPPIFDLLAPKYNTNQQAESTKPLNKKELQKVLAVAGLDTTWRC